MLIRFNWQWSTTRDYTASIYSIQNLELKNPGNTTYEWYMDGDHPSGFTLSQYTTEYADRVKPEMFGPKSLQDVFRAAPTFEKWMEIFWTHPWLAFWWWTW